MSWKKSNNTNDYTLCHKCNKMTFLTKQEYNDEKIKESLWTCKNCGVIIGYALSRKNNILDL